MHEPKGTFLAALTGLIVALTAITFRATGYGTLLSQTILLGSWGLVARLVSPQFADRYDSVVWLVTAVVNGLLFSLPAGIIYHLTRQKLRRFRMPLLIGWTFAYLGLLFWLFPATDGP